MLVTVEELKKRRQHEIFYGSDHPVPGEELVLVDVSHSQDVTCDQMRQISSEEDIFKSLHSSPSKSTSPKKENSSGECSSPLLFEDEESNHELYESTSNSSQTFFDEDQLESWYTMDGISRATIKEASTFSCVPNSIIISEGKAEKAIKDNDLMEVDALKDHGILTEGYFLNIKLSYFPIHAKKFHSLFVKKIFQTVSIQIIPTSTFLLKFRNFRHN